MENAITSNETWEHVVALTNHIKQQYVEKKQHKSIDDNDNHVTVMSSMHRYSERKKSKAKLNCNSLI